LCGAGEPHNTHTSFCEPLVRAADIGVLDRSLHPLPAHCAHPVCRLSPRHRVALERARPPPQKKSQHHFLKNSGASKIAGEGGGAGHRRVTAEESQETTAEETIAEGSGKDTSRRDNSSSEETTAVHILSLLSYFSRLAKKAFHSVSLSSPSPPLSRSRSISELIVQMPRCRPLKQRQAPSPARARLGDEGVRGRGGRGAEPSLAQS
jgi:hypothetical protein